MSRFIFALFILINNNVLAQTNDELAIHTQPANPFTESAKALADSNPANQPASTASHTAQVIIPSKTVCRQRVTTFFIVAVPDNLLKESEKQSVTPTITPKTVYTLPAGGTDMLELQLKSPGRMLENPELSSFLSIEALAQFLNCSTLTVFLPQ